MKFSKEHILDELLILKIQNGDMKSFSLLYQRWHPKLIKHAFYMTRDNEGTRDVVQEAWQGIAKGIRKLKDPSAFKTWAYRIVNNKSANWIKEQQKQRILKEESKDTLVYDDNGVSESEESIMVIRRALKELPPDSRAILSMFYLEGSTVKELANIFSVSEGTVKSRLFYARKALKEKVENLNRSL